MKKLLLVFFLLSLGSIDIPNVVYAAQPGYYTRVDCGNLATPVTNGTACLQTTTVSGRTAGKLYVWSGSAWVAGGVDFSVPGTDCSNVLTGKVIWDFSLRQFICATDQTTPGGAGITTLNTLSGASQTFVNDTNLSIVSSGTTHTLTWLGTLAAARLNANVVQAITNDTNVTGSISAQNLTLGWAGALAKARQNTQTVYLDQANTWSAGAQDLSAAASFKPPTSAGAAPTTSGFFAYDSTANKFSVGINGSNRKLLSDGDFGVTAQAWDADLDAVAALGSTGFAVRTAANTWAQRSFVDQANVLTWTNPAGVAGNPTPAVATPILDGSSRGCTSATGNDSYACNLTPAPSGYVVNADYYIKADVANTGAASANFNALGALAIKKFAGGVKVDLATGDIPAGCIAHLKPDGTDFQLASPCGATGSGSVTGSGTANKVAIFTSASVIGDSTAYSEDADSANISKKIEVGDITTNSLTFDTSAVTASKTATWPNVSGSVMVDGAVVFNAETPGNTLTIPVYLTWEAAACDNATASPGMDRPTSGAPTATCFGTTTTQGALDFADAATSTATRHFRLPSDWTGNVDVNLVWFANSASANAVRWSVASGCVADSEAVSTGPSYNTASASNTAYTGTANQRKTTAFTSIATTNCSASETFYLQVQRIGADGGDTLAATAELLEVGVTLRRAM